MSKEKIIIIVLSVGLLIALGFNIGLVNVINNYKKALSEANNTNSSQNTKLNYDVLKPTITDTEEVTLTPTTTPTLTPKPTTAVKSTSTPTPTATTSEVIKTKVTSIYFFKQGTSSAKSEYQFPVERTIQYKNTKEAIEAILDEMQNGPTVEEESSNNLVNPLAREFFTGESLCGGGDYQVTAESSTLYVVSFCRGNDQPYIADWIIQDMIIDAVRKIDFNATVMVKFPN